MRFLLFFLTAWLTATGLDSALGQAAGSSRSPSLRLSPNSLPPIAEAPRSANYRISASDVIAIKIFPQPDLDRQCRVAKDGTIDFPLIRTVSVAGKTTTEAGAYLAALLNRDYLVNPQVTVDVVTYAKLHYMVMGQVQSPGTFALPEEEELTLVGAIAAAGGATRLADIGKITLQRGNAAPVTFDLRPGAKSPPTVKIQPNDVIYVKERTF